MDRYEEIEPDEEVLQEVIRTLSPNPPPATLGGIYLYQQIEFTPNGIRFEGQMYTWYYVEHISAQLSQKPRRAHLGIEKMFEKVRDRYYWPQMYEHIRKYVQAYDACQKHGKNRIQDLTTSGNKYIIVAVDYMTNQHGCPSEIVLDRGLHFNNDMIRYLTQQIEIKHLLLTSYHPQTNGLVKRYNCTLCQVLAKLVNQDQEWDTLISSILFVYRTAKQSTTRFIPFYLTYRCEAKYPDINSNQEGSKNLADQLTTIINDLPVKRSMAVKNINCSQR
ncbi:13793_t:CDS:2 [Dentiscutata erythropus]|uniref:13793_t:CDS:1 n=1 Tax=Dentiscutata erythropus TaxID=1348616 RepID=A0A9N9GUG7_9GLOM|nr:13793_t:CDS:2 [Dentiscutata erythropus]